MFLFTIINICLSLLRFWKCVERDNPLANAFYGVLHLGLAILSLIYPDSPEMITITTFFVVGIVLYARVEPRG